MNEDNILATPQIETPYKIDPLVLYSLKYMDALEYKNPIPIKNENDPFGELKLLYSELSLDKKQGKKAFPDTSIQNGFDKLRYKQQTNYDFTGEIASFLKEKDTATKLFLNDEELEKLVRISGHIPDSTINETGPSIREEEACQVYAAKMAAAPSVIPKEELDRIVGMLFASGYTMAFRELDETVLDPAVQLKTEKRARVKTLTDKAKGIEANTELAKLFEQEVGPHYNIRIVRPQEPYEELVTMIAGLDLCWKTGNTKRNGSIIKALQRDTDIGACIQFIGRYAESSASYTRNYIATTKGGEHILFLDTIESGNIGWSSVNEWNSARRGKELLYQLAATIYTAGVLGLEKIGLGEREMTDVAEMFGFREQTIFGDRTTQPRKLGIRVGSVGGPKTFTIDGDARANVVYRNEVEAPGLAYLIERVEAVEAFTRTNRRALKNQNKREDVTLYLDAVYGINERVYHNDQLRGEIDSVRARLVTT